MDIYSGAILASLIIYIAVGNYAGRRVKKLTTDMPKCFSQPVQHSRITIYHLSVTNNFV